MVPGRIYKNVRHHPGRIFMVRKVRKVNGQIRSVQGEEINPLGDISSVNYPIVEFNRAFPFVMWIPPSCPSS